jgi:hypothetical protein
MMINFLRNRSPSLSWVVLVLLVIVFLQGSISYSTTFGVLSRFIPATEDSPTASAWLGLRFILIMVVLLLWLLTRTRHLFRAIIITNGFLTFGLFMNMLSLLDALTRLTAQAAESLVVDVVLMAITNILIFSIWYWIIDPPGIDETQRVDEPWDFLFPQRDADLPHYESWLPRYTDYLYLAFTTSFAFSPTDTLPLTRRAKMLMLLQSTISIITLTGIAASAIGLLAGSKLTGSDFRRSRSSWHQPTSQNPLAPADSAATFRSFPGCPPTIVDGCPRISSPG